MSPGRLALELLHGRADPEASLPDWGRDGPVFLIDWLHVTYLSCLTVGLPAPENEGEIPLRSGCLVYDGVAYGDWTVHPAEELSHDPALAGRLQPFRPQPGSPTHAPAGRNVIHE